MGDPETSRRQRRLSRRPSLDLHHYSQARGTQQRHQSVGMSRWIRSAAMIGRVSRHQFMNNPKLQSSTSISLPLPTPTRLEYLGSAVQSCPPRACGHLNRDDLVYETLRKCGAHSLAHASRGLLPLRRIVSWLGQRRRSRRRNSNPQAIVHRHARSRPWKWHRLGQHNRLGKLWI